MERQDINKKQPSKLKQDHEGRVVITSCQVNDLHYQRALSFDGKKLLRREVEFHIGLEGFGPKVENIRGERTVHS